MPIDLRNLRIHLKDPKPGSKYTYSLCVQDDCLVACYSVCVNDRVYSNSCHINLSFLEDSGYLPRTLVADTLVAVRSSVLAAVHSNAIPSRRISYAHLS
jgi:hypothetical protein